MPARKRMFEERGQVRVPGYGTFAIGRGHSFADLPAVLVLKLRGDTITQILAADQSGRRIARIWPPYHSQTSFRGQRFVVATAVTAAEDMAARALLAQIHPEGAAAHGLLICLYALGDDDDRELVGVAQVGEYYHTRPCGRDVVSGRAIGPGFHRLGRGAEIKAIPIASAKRFVITQHRQGEGLGRLLGRQSLKVARDHRWPSARVVEVVRRQNARSFLAICYRSERDFLTRSGYVPVPPAKWTRNGQIIMRVAAIPAHQLVAGYYYADLTDAARPRFVARAVAQIGGQAVRTAGD